MSDDFIEIGGIRFPKDLTEAQAKAALKHVEQIDQITKKIENNLKAIAQFQIANAGFELELVNYREKNHIAEFLAKVCNVSADELAQKAGMRALRDLFLEYMARSKGISKTALGLYFLHDDEL